MNTRPFAQVDVFTATPYRGNPLAVVLDGSDLSTEQMQHFTNWTNLSECTFLLPPTQKGADYRVRIFCPGRELPFAGHPTLGTAHAWLAVAGEEVLPVPVVDQRIQPVDGLGPDISALAAVAAVRAAELDELLAAEADAARPARAGPHLDAGEVEELHRPARRSRR